MQMQKMVCYAKHQNTNQRFLFPLDNVLPLFDDVPPPPTVCIPRTLIDLAGSSTKSSETKSAANELDELFGSLTVMPDSKPTVVPSTQNELDDCLPLFSSTSTKATNPSEFFFENLSAYHERFIFIAASSTQDVATSSTIKKGGLFDDLQDLLVDQSTGQKISSTRKYAIVQVVIPSSFLFQHISIHKFHKQ